MAAPAVRERRRASRYACHHSLAEALHAYIAAAGIADDRKGWMFRTSPRHSATVLTGQPMRQAVASRMTRRRAVAGAHRAHPGLADADDLGNV